MLAVELPLVEVPTEKVVFVVGSSVCVVGSVVCCVALLLIGDVLVKIETPSVLMLDVEIVSVSELVEIVSPSVDLLVVVFAVGVV